jgi:excisionase family DNA binding protein
MFLTLTQITQQLPVARESVRHWIKSGKLPAYKPGRHLLVRRDELEALIASTAVVRAKRTGAK